MTPLLAVLRQSKRLMRRWARDQRGVTALEYGLIAAVTVTAIVASINSMSQPVANAFKAACNALQPGLCP
jgi:Flp pilus assembly pilin Flp